MPPETKYARSGDVSIAYQVIGKGSLDVVLAPGAITHLRRCAKSRRGFALSSGWPPSRA